MRKFMYSSFESRWVVTISLLISLFVLSSCVNPELQSYDPVTMDSPAIDKDYPPYFKELFIPSGEVLMSGFMLGANGQGPNPSVILLHGYPGNEKNLDLAQSMRRAGFNVLFFHYRGAWGSQGTYAFSHLADDVTAALDYLKTNSEALKVDINRLSIIGHSIGGFTALRAASQNDDVVCVGGLAAANLGEYARRDASAKQGFKRYTDHLFVLNGFDGAKALAEINRYADAFDVTTYGDQLKGKSVLLITGEQDIVVPPSVQARITQSYAQVDGLDLNALVISGDHAFSISRIELQRKVVSWLQSKCS